MNVASRYDDGCGTVTVFAWSLILNPPRSSLVSRAVGVHRQLADSRFPVFSDCTGTGPPKYPLRLPGSSTLSVL